MKRKILLAGTFIISALAFMGCQQQTQNSAAQPTSTSTTASLEILPPSTQTSKASLEILPPTQQTSGASLTIAPTQQPSAVNLEVKEPAKTPNTK